MAAQFIVKTLPCVTDVRTLFFHSTEVFSNYQHREIIPGCRIHPGDIVEAGMLAVSCNICLICKLESKEKLSMKKFSITFVLFVN